jgi:DNA invertase Pin-like site-specific DNA recombinase
MSTEHQRYSLANQSAAIAEYAGERGYEVIETYADAGKSGLSLRGRKALQRLLTDALNPSRSFEAILVLDVSRWGRFQDPDQSAHYEFICRQAGLTVAYCAEPFENDGSPVTTILKHLKRVMAGEYSRELSGRLSRAKLHGARLGFKQGGGLAYGFRRQLVDETGKPRFILEPGQTKALSTDHVTIVLGPPEEQEIIRRIFHLYVRRELSMEAIAAQLRADGCLGSLGRPWSRNMVRTLLNSELCVGRYVYHRTTTRLQGRKIKTDPSQWVRVTTMPPIISEKLFRKAQERIARREGNRLKDEQMLADLRHLWKTKGWLSSTLIAGASGLATTTTYRSHFGSIRGAYERIGYCLPESYGPSGSGRWSEDELLDGLRRLHGAQGFVSAKTIEEASDMAGISVYMRRFGSLRRAYEAAGLGMSHPEIIQAAYARRRARELVSPRPKRPRAQGSGATSIFSDDDLLDGLRRILASHGHVTAKLINDDRQMPAAAVVARRFGSLLKAYLLIGEPGSMHDVMVAMHVRRAQRHLSQTRHNETTR